MIFPRLAIIVFILFQSAVLRADNRLLWDDAGASYDNGDYAGAAEIYRKLIEREAESPELYYNLGNSDFKSGNLGASIWAYRRALKLDHGMEQARVNLDYVRQFNIDKIEIKGAGFIDDIWGFVTGFMSANGYLVMLSFSWWLLGAVAAFMILKPKSAVWPQYLLILSILLVIFSATASVTRLKYDRFSRWGVLTVPSADIREGPGEDFERIEVGHEGLEFRILGQRERGLLIELENGLKGWVSLEAVLEI